MKTIVILLAIVLLSLPATAQLNGPLVAQGSGATLDMSLAGLTKPFGLLGSEPTSGVTACSNAVAWAEGPTSHDQFHCIGGVWTVYTSGLAAISTLNVLSNITGGSAVPTGNTLTAIVDAAFGSTQGSILYRGASAWTALVPGTSGYFLETQGSAANPQWAAATGGSADGFYATSSTSHGIFGTGSVTWTTQAGLAYANGVYATACSIGTPTACFYGQVTSYSGTTLTINCVANSNPGDTYTDWQFVGSLVPMLFAFGTAGSGAPTFVNGLLNIPLGGSGTVTTAGSPASPQIAKFSSATAITTATQADLNAEGYAAGGGIAQAQTVTLSPAVTSLVTGLVVNWLPTAANTGAAPTLAVNGLAAKAITKLGTTALVANDLTTTAIASAVYDGTEFQLQNPQTNSGGGGSPTGAAGGDLGGTYPNPTVVKVEAAVCGFALSNTSGACGLNTAIAPSNTIIQNNTDLWLNSATGTTAYAATPSAQNVLALAAGQVFLLTVDTACTTTATLTITGLASTSLDQIDGSTACNGAMQVGRPMHVYYDGSVFRMMETVSSKRIQANAVGSPQMAVVNTRRVCDIPVGNESASAIVTAQLGPQKRLCYIPAAATIVELDVSADAGTPNVIVGNNAAGSVTNIVSSALATASAGGIACSNVGGTTGIDGATTCSATLQNTALAAGSYLELVSGTPGGTAKLMTMHVVYTIN